MKKIGLLSLFVLLCLTASGQGFEWTFYSENGEPFTLFIDGDKINPAPSQRVVAPGIKGVFKTVRIEFQDARIPKVTKRMPLKPGIESLTTVIKQNNKGEYILRVVDGTEGAADGSGDAPAAVAVAPAAGGTQPAATQSAQAPSSGPITAKFSSDVISLSDGRTFNTKRTKLFGAGAGIEMIAPEGAQVTVTQDDGKEVYTNDVPFEYNVKDFSHYDKYFKIEVTEGSAKWSVKIKNNNGFKIVIEQGEGGAAVQTSEPAPTATSAASTGQSAAAEGQGAGKAGMAAGASASGYSAYGQSQNAGDATWVIYSEMGEKFIAFVDGQQANGTPSARVSIPGLSGQNKQVRIEFEDASIPKILKRFPVVGGGETTIMIKKNKKGEFVMNAVSAPKAEFKAPEADAPAASEPTSSGPVTAKLTEDQIQISDGQNFTVTRKKIPGGWPGAEVEMLAPEGASVVITQDGGKEVYTGEVPFVYKVQGTEYYNNFFKLEVSQGSKKWSVKIKNANTTRIVITE